MAVIVDSVNLKNFQSELNVLNTELKSFKSRINSAKEQVNSTVGTNFKKAVPKGNTICTNLSNLLTKLLALEANLNQLSIDCREYIDYYEKASK